MEGMRKYRVGNRARESKGREEEPGRNKKAEGNSKDMEAKPGGSREINTERQVDGKTGTRGNTGGQETPETKNQVSAKQEGTGNMGVAKELEEGRRRRS